MLLLETKNLSKHFGGLKALDGIDMRVERETDREHHRPERRRENHVLQLHYRHLSAQQGKRDLSRPGHYRHAAPRYHRPRHCPHVSEYPPLRRHDLCWRMSWSPPTAAPRPGSSARCSGRRECMKEERDMGYRAMDILRFTGLENKHDVTGRRTFPTATSAGSRSPGRSARSLICCCSMNRQPA